MAHQTNAGINLDECLEVATKLARQAGQVILSAFHEEKEIEKKSAFDLVTETGRPSSPPPPKSSF